MRLPTIQEIEKAIDLPTEKWRGQCFGIASSIVESGLIKGRAVYGYYTGPIARTSNPFGDRAGLPFVHHGWIVTPRGVIVDPTRWVFEDVEPYLFQLDPCDCLGFDPDDDLDVLCCCGNVIEEHRNDFSQSCKFDGREYDEGGQRFLEDNATPCPEALPGDKTVSLMLMLSDAQFVVNACHLDLETYEFPTTITAKQAMWLANLSVHILGEYAEGIFRALIRADLGAFIPVDARQMVLKDAYPDSVKA